MRLVHLFKYYWPDNGGGIASGMDMVIYAFKKWCKNKEFTENDTQEILVCWQKAGKPASKDRYNGIPVYRCKSLFEFASTQFSPMLMRVVNKKTKAADMVIYHFPYPLIDLGILLGMVHGKLVVAWHCDFDTQKGKVITRLYAPLVKHTLKKASIIVVGAKGTIHGSKVLHKFRDKCFIIPYAVNNDLITEGKEYFKHRGDEKRGKVHVLFIGRFVWYKGIDILLKAFKELDPNRYELTLIGDGPLFDNMKNLAEELGLFHVVFTGSVSEKEKREWIKWSDFLVLPSVSKAESFAIVQIEAMAFGKPVINTWLPSGVPDVSPNLQTGFTVEAKNEQALANAMQKLGEDNEMRREFGENAIKLVEERYTMARFSEKYGKVFDSLR